MLDCNSRCVSLIEQKLQTVIDERKIEEESVAGKTVASLHLGLVSFYTPQKLLELT